MTRVKGPDGLVTDVAHGLAVIVVGDGSRGFEFVDAPEAPKRPTRKRPSAKAERTEPDTD